MKPLLKSTKLANVCYDIRGPVMERAKLMEEEGQRIIKLNIGNLAPFGFEAPEEIQQDVILNLPNSSGYSDSKGMFAARKAIMHYCQSKKIMGVGLDDIYIGNGASELIVMAMQGLLNTGDEVLVPAPDYPLWTAAVTLAGGTPRHYLCDEADEWNPDLADMRSKITKNTRAIVVINPNNPTGALYSDAILLEIIQIAREHELVIFADEIYDKMLYDGARHTSMASLADDVLFVTMNGLSKNYRACGYRAGWMVLSGEKKHAQDYINGLTILASMRLCSNVPGQFAIQTALRLSEHRRSGRAERQAGEAARPRLQIADRDSGRDLRQTEGGAVSVSAFRSEAVSDQGRPAVHPRTAGRGEGAGGAGQRLQLAASGPHPRGVPADRG